MNPHPTQITIDEILTRGADPCENRHKQNPQSIEAHKKVLPSKDATYRRIMEVLAKGPQTSKEIAATLNVQLNCISGRYSEMKALGWIRETGEKREGAAVLEGIKPMSDFEIVRCPACKKEIVAANTVFCYVCVLDNPPDMCGDCLDAHMKTHSEAEIDAVLTA